MKDTCIITILVVIDIVSVRLCNISTQPDKDMVVALVIHFWARLLCRLRL